MMMGAIQDDYGTVPGCLAAAKAGVDLLFVSHSMELAAQVARALAEEAAAGRLDAGELAASVARMEMCIRDSIYTMLYMIFIHSSI